MEREAISYQPIAHHELVNRTKTFLGDQGFTIQDEVHSLARKTIITLVCLQSIIPIVPNQIVVALIGLRNSHDKTFPAGLCAGDAPFVCDNLIFTNTIKLARRHTRNILQDLNFTINRAWVNCSGFGMVKISASMPTKKSISPMLKSMTLSFSACKAGALPKSKIIDVVDQWEASDHPEFWDRNVNSLYNAFTEVYKGNLVALPNRSDALHSVLDGEVNFDMGQHVENVLDMEVIEDELVEV